MIVPFQLLLLFLLSLFLLSVDGVVAAGDCFWCGLVVGVFAGGGCFFSIVFVVGGVVALGGDVVVG